MSTEISYREFRENLADVLNRIEYRNETFDLTRRGKKVAALVPQMKPDEVPEAIVDRAIAAYEEVVIEGGNFSEMVARAVVAAVLPMAQSMDQPDPDA